jgi:hypothetical protein
LAPAGGSAPGAPLQPPLLFGGLELGGGGKPATAAPAPAAQGNIFGGLDYGGPSTAANGSVGNRPAAPDLFGGLNLDSSGSAPAAGQNATALDTTFMGGMNVPGVPSAFVVYCKDNVDDLPCPLAALGLSLKCALSLGVLLCVCVCGGGGGCSAWLGDGLMAPKFICPYTLVFARACVFVEVVWPPSQNSLQNGTGVETHTEYNWRLLAEDWLLPPHNSISPRAHTLSRTAHFVGSIKPRSIQWPFNPRHGNVPC